MRKWKKTKHPGVRYREHETRKHGIGKDRYFAIRYQMDGKRHEEGTGWTSEGWTAERAAVELAELKKNFRLGEGKPLTLQEKREREKQKKQKTEKDALTFGEYFENSYYPSAETSKKAGSHKKELEHFKLWIAPVLKSMEFKKITPIAIERIKKNLLDGGRSPRTIQAIFTTVRTIWNQARRDRVVFEDSPTKQVKIPKFDNRRQRFLTHDEAAALLEDLQKRDFKVYRMAFLSLHTGLRAGEIFSLKWGHIDTERGLIRVSDGKSGKSRAAYMTGEVKEMFLRMNRGGPEDVVFPNSDGERFTEIPKTFKSAVDTVGLNKGMADRRQKVCFHTLRHSFASWHVQGGTDLYTVKELLGHGTIAMTERYSHLSPEGLKNAVKRFENGIAEAKEEKSNVIELRK